MTPTIFAATALVVALVLIYAVVRRVSSDGRASRTFELGTVSTRWLSELRRDDTYP